ncbi:MAG: hypothetical protein SF029_01310 [bacterium]|nr:hypothetical protein [bacterium]
MSVKSPRQVEQRKERYRQNLVRKLKAQQLARQQEEATAPTRKLLSSVLDGLNAMGALSRCDPTGWLVYGPKGFTGQNWAGALLWCRPNGYHAYKTLTVVGVWARMLEGETGSTVHLCIGHKTAAYTAPFFQPEAYQHALKRGFQQHYGADGSPPDEAAWLWHEVYAAEKRLALRTSVESVLAAWVESMTQV